MHLKPSGSWKINEIKTDDGIVIRHGLVAVSDGKVSPQSRHLVVTKDSILLQKQCASNCDSASGNRPFPLDSKEREVIVVKQNGSGLGLSIKGGAEHGLPVFISRVFRDQAADLTGQLFVGDAILSVNGHRLKNYTHEQTLKVMRDTGDVVTLVVKHYRASTPFLLRNSTNAERCAEILQDCPYLRAEEGWETVADVNDSLSNSRRSSSPADISQASSIANDSNFWALDGEWIDIATVPLKFAYITRYIYGTDQMRRNAFEVRGTGGKSTGVITILEPAALSQWIRHISDAIQSINASEMTLHNRLLPGVEQVIYIGWIHERVPSSEAQNISSNGYLWLPVFIGLKGDAVLFFKEPPVDVNDWNTTAKAFLVLEVMFRPLRDSEHLDDRPNCFTLQVIEESLIESRYFSVETRQDFLRFENAWHRAMTSSAIRTGVKSFPVMCDGLEGTLTLNWNDGFIFAASEGPEWSYKFSQLKGSSDDGKETLKFHFRQADGRGIDRKEITCSDLHSLIYCMTSFLTAKVATIDPSFVKVDARKSGI
ncbi:gamma-1-syntrophin-like [Artemia franciscana]